MKNDFNHGARLCLTPHVAGVGGMVSFRARLIAGLKRYGIEVCDDLDQQPYSAILVIGGTRRLLGLLRARQRGIPVVQRLDGMNWLHRRLGWRRLGLRHFLRAEYGNGLLTLIRDRLASQVVYQSEFSRNWWERVRGPTPVPATVIYNGIDLTLYHPAGLEQPPIDRWRVLLIEASLAGGYEAGLKTAIRFMKILAEQLQQQPPPGFPGILELMIVGKVSPELRLHWQNETAGSGFPASLQLNWVGQVPGTDIPALARAAHLLYSADIHPACPNSVIEAMACGLPVLALDTGALSELVVGDAGRLVPYGGNPWQLDPPNLDGLARSALEILMDQNHFRMEARRQAETAFGLQEMTAAYLEVLFKP